MRLAAEARMRQKSLSPLGLENKNHCLRHWRWVARNASNVHSRCGLFQSANPGSSLRRELEDFRRLRSLVRLAAWPWSCGLGTGTVTALAFGILQFLVVSGVTAFQPAV